MSARDELDDDDPEVQRLILTALVTTRLDAIREVTSWLRQTPRYDKDHAALLRAARRIEEWASQ